MPPSTQSGDPSNVPDSSILSLPSAKSIYQTVNGVRLHIVAVGDESGQSVVLLHGFPDFFYGWRHVIPSLVQAGYRVLVPDQRGYNLSEKPTGIAPYQMSELARDIVELVASEGSDAAHLVGHDFGGAVAWNVALRYPESVDRLSVLNMPHPTVFRQALWSNLGQLRRSWYAFFFLLPRLPEWYVSRRDYRAMVRAVRTTAAPGTFTDEDIERYRTAWSQDGAVAGMLNSYRAAYRYPFLPLRNRVKPPTLMIWGTEDAYLVSELAPESLEYCEDGRLEWVPDASHWVHHERPGRVTDLLLEHL